MVLIRPSQVRPTPSPRVEPDAASRRAVLHHPDADQQDVALRARAAHTHTAPYLDAVHETDSDNPVGDALRFCFVNPQTTPADIDLLLDDIVAFGPRGDVDE